MRTEEQDIADTLGRRDLPYAEDARRIDAMLDKKRAGAYSALDPSILIDVIAPAICLRGLVACLHRANERGSFVEERVNALPYMRLLARVCLPDAVYQSAIKAQLETSEIAYLIFAKCRSGHSLILNATAGLYGAIGGNSAGQNTFRISNRVRMLCLSKDYPAGYSWLSFSVEDGALAMSGGAQDLISQQKDHFQHVSGFVTMPPPSARSCMAAFRFYALTDIERNDTNGFARQAVEVWRTVFTISLFGASRS